MNARRWMLGTAAAGVVFLMAMSSAWACVSGPAVKFSTTTAKPGDTIAVTGSGFNAKGSVVAHWNALNGPVLATMHVPDAATGAMGSFTVPADAQTGTYVVVFLQQAADGTLQQAPIRGVVSVSGNGVAAPLTPAAAARADGLVTNHSSVAVAGLALTAVGVAGGVILLAGLGVFVAGRRRGEAETVRSGR